VEYNSTPNQSSSVYIDPTWQNSPPKKNKFKTPFIILGILILFTLSAILPWYLITKGGLNFKSILQINTLTSDLTHNTETINKFNSTDDNLQGLPTVFYTELKYNPLTKTVKQVKIERTKGEPFFLNESVPNTSNFLPYQIEVVTKQNKILQKGWRLALNNFDTDNQIILPIAVKYYQEGILNVYLRDGSLIWSNSIQ